MITKPTPDVRAILEELEEHILLIHQDAGNTLESQTAYRDKGKLLAQKALNKYYQDYYLGLLPEKREKVDPINARTLDGISSNAFNQAIDLMEARIREQK